MNKRAGGFTLVEILIVTLLGSLIMGSIYQMITIQDKTTRQQYAIVQNNQNARMALSLVSADLKEMSARDGDVRFADSTAIEFRALRKAGIVCNKDMVSDSWIDIMEVGAPFDATDSLLVFADGANATQAGDQWIRLQPSSVGAGQAVGLCALTPLGNVTIRRLNFTNDAVDSVFSGGLVRSFGWTRYALVDDGEFGEIQRTENGTTVPVIESLANVAESGLHMRFIDSTSAVIPYSSLRDGGAQCQAGAGFNAATCRLRHIMRVQIKVRGKSPTQVSTTGANRFTDSLVTQVYVRGNARSR